MLFKLILINTIFVFLAVSVIGESSVNETQTQTGDNQTSVDLKNETFKMEEISIDYGMHNLTQQFYSELEEFVIQSLNLTEIVKKLPLDTPDDLCHFWMSIDVVVSVKEMIQSNCAKQLVIRAVDGKDKKSSDTFLGQWRSGGGDTSDNSDPYGDKKKWLHDNFVYIVVGGILLISVLLLIVICCLCLK